MMFETQRLVEAVKTCQKDKWTSGAELVFLYFFLQVRPVKISAVK